jgi:lantibiotic biosynthesis protein
MNRTDFDRTLTATPVREDETTSSSLAIGPLGTALYLATHPNPPQHPLAWLGASMNPSVFAGARTNLLIGAPALAFTFATITGGTEPKLHDAVLETIRDHLTQADKRIANGHAAHFEDYDHFSGLTGLGAYLVHTDPAASELTTILDHLALLADPARCNCDGLPLWWVHHAPNTSADPTAYKHGHGNFGAAHGIAGPLALLALAAIEDIGGPRHTEAIGHYLAIFDHWQQGDAAPWWPEHITLDELDANAPVKERPGRPSWCYGTPGIARAQQLAGIALGDRDRSILAATALRSSLTDPAQLDLVIDSSLCHGWAGIYQTAWRAAQDEPDIIDQPLLDSLAARIQLSGGYGLLEGRPGQALALLTTEGTTEPSWDLLLLLA